MGSNEVIQTLGKKDGEIFCQIFDVIDLDRLKQLF